MGHMQTWLRSQTGSAFKQQGLLSRHPMCADKHVGKGGVGFVGVRVGQCDFKSRNQLQSHGRITVVVNIDLPEFDIVLRADPHRGAGAQVCPTGIQTQAICMKRSAVLRGWVCGRVLGQGERCTARVSAQVQETTLRVAQSIVPLTTDSGLTPMAPTRTVRAYRDGIAAVGEQMGRLYGCATRDHVTDHARRTTPL